jgi:hypothetical protein
MRPAELPSTFWLRWLLVTTTGVMAFGLALVFAPDLARQGFSLLVYADTVRITTFGADAVAYISLLHAVLGSVMFGWGVALLLVIRGLFARGVSDGWLIIAVSVVLWFVPDTAYSLWSGFWQNALLNVVFIILFGVPLAATYRAFHGTRA